MHRLASICNHAQAIAVLKIILHKNIRNNTFNVMCQLKWPIILYNHNSIHQINSVFLNMVAWLPEWWSNSGYIKQHMIVDVFKCVVHLSLSKICVGVKLLFSCIYQTGQAKLDHVETSMLNAVIRNKYLNKTRYSSP